MVFELDHALALFSADHTKHRSIQARVQAVQAAQRCLGMEPRNDSRLTYLYAVGDCMAHEPPSVIAHELVTVDTIYRETEYGQIIEDVLRELAAHLRRTYALSWTDTWDIVRFYGPTMLKLYLVRQRDLIHSL